MREPEAATLRILIYTHVFPPMVGGIETITRELAQRLAQSCEPTFGQPVRVTVVTPQAAGAQNEASLPFGIVRKPGLLQLITLLSEADIVHIAGLHMLPLLLAWLLRKCVVVEHHTFQSACPHGQMFYERAQTPCPGHFLARRYHRCLSCNPASGPVQSLKRLVLTFPRRWLSAQARANVLPTEWLGTILQLPGMVTIHHGLAAPDNAIAPQMSALRSIVFLGRLVSSKGVGVLLQAVHRLPDCEFRLDIIGDGPERSRLEADVRSLGLEARVFFRGYLRASDAEKVLAQATAVVMPSLGGEVFGLVALENMLRKKVLIISDIGSMSEVVGDAGLTFPAGDALSLANCLRQVLQSEDFSQQLAERAGQRANSLFTPEHMVAEHAALYQRLLRPSYHAERSTGFHTHTSRVVEGPRPPAP